MPKLGSAERRDKKRSKLRKGMQVGSRSPFIILQKLKKRAKQYAERKTENV